MSHALVKICGSLPTEGIDLLLLLRRQGSAAQKAVDVRLQLQLQVVLIDLDPLDDQLQILPVQAGLAQNIRKHLQGGLGGTVDLEDGVALVRDHAQLVFEALDPSHQVRLQRVVGLLQQRLLIRVLHQVPYPLPLGGLQLLLEPHQDVVQVGGAALGFLYLLPLPGQIGVELNQHGGGVVSDPPDVDLDELVQLIHTDVVAGAAGASTAVVGAAGVGGAQVAAAHGEHRGAAVSAHQKPGVDVVVFFLPPVVGTGALLPERAGSGKGAVVDDGLVVVLNNDLVHDVPLYVPAVDFGSGVLPLAEGADVEVVIQDPLDGDDGPSWFYCPAALLAGGLPAQLF